MYLRLYDKKIDPKDWFGTYVTIYLERTFGRLKTLTIFLHFSGS